MEDRRNKESTKEQSVTLDLVVMFEEHVAQDQIHSVMSWSGLTQLLFDLWHNSCSVKCGSLSRRTILCATKEPNDVHSSVNDKRYEHIHAVNDKPFFKKKKVALSTTRATTRRCQGQAIPSMLIPLCSFCSDHDLPLLAKVAAAEWRPNVSPAE